jgi:membrane complex biogenesis BtpA family protein
MAAIAERIRAEVEGGLALGVNVLRNDARASLAVALACGAKLVRVNVHVGAAWTDQGLVTGRAHDTLRYRRELGLEPGVQIAADVLVKHAVPAGTRDVATAATETAMRGGADILVITGAPTGAPADLEDVRRAREAVPGVPVWVGSGVTADSLPSVIAAADGAIIGTALHRDGDLRAPLDLDRVRRVAERAAEAKAPR